jgi:putative ABC transport system permease protein
MNLFAKLRYLFESHRSRQEFEDEIENHIGMLAERFRARGMTPEDALSAARRQFGNGTSLRETRNEMQTFVWLETLWHDLRYGARLLRRNKAFASVAVLTLALGIGANTAIFSVVNAVIFRPLPYPDPGRLAVLWGNVKRVRVERRGTTYPDFQDWRDHSHRFTAMAAYDDHTFALTGVDNPEALSGEFVSASYFPLLGISTQKGRTFNSEEDRVPQRDAVAVLSDRLWKRRFGADPSILGRTIQLDGRAYTVVGVAPPGFQGLTDAAEVWAPYTMSGSAYDLGSRRTVGLRVLARLRPGVSMAQAQAEMDTIAKRLEQAYPGDNQGRGVEVVSLEQETTGDIRQPLFVLLAAVGFVLLIASTNVATLLLARSETRQHEVAMRTALGASHARIIRQLLAESAILVALGCVTGIALAHYGIVALMAASPLQFPSFVHPTIDASVALFTIAISCLVAIALGLAPATQGSTAGIVSRSAIGRRSSRFRDGLVVAEISLSLLLLIGAGLMIRGLRNLMTTDPGYDPTHVVALQLGLPQAQISASGDILRRVSSLPSVESASVGSDTPFTGQFAIYYTAEGQALMTAQTMPRAYLHRVSPDFFRTLRTRFLYGRPFSANEIHDGANVAIVSENMVRRFWPGENPIGRRIKLGRADVANPWLTIVGVVGDMRYRGLLQNPTADPDLFVAFNERSQSFAVLVRTSIDAASMLPAIRAAARQAEPSILVFNADTLENIVASETAGPRFGAGLMTIFATLALFLAAIGIYGVISYGVSRRTREIGLRVALGSGRSGVLRLVVGRGMVLVIAGLLLGTAAALVITRLMASLIQGVSPTDPLTFAGACALLSFVALIACLMPAMRASRIDPAVALREQ